jgi:hypothetical protein
VTFTGRADIDGVFEFVTRICLKIAINVCKQGVSLSRRNGRR